MSSSNLMQTLSFLLALLTVLFGLSSCAPVPAETSGNTEDPNQTSGTTTGDPNGEENPSPEGGSAYVNSGLANIDPDAPEPIPEGYMALGANGKSSYQIIYPAEFNDSLRPAVERLASEIEAASGAHINIRPDNEALEFEYEIRLGHTAHLADAETHFSEYANLNDADYVIKTEGKIVYIYSQSDVGILNGIDYFRSKMLYTSPENAYAGIDPAFSRHYTYGQPPVTVFEGSDENYLYFITNVGTLDESYVRLSFTGNKAWRIQSKQRAVDAFQDIGASQRLSLSLAEAPVLNLEPIEVDVTESPATTVTATAPDGSYVILDCSSFSLKFYTPSGELAQHISELTSNNGDSSIKGDLLPEEGVFGTGGRSNTVNMRNQNINMFTKDNWARADATYVVIPLLTFTRGSGVFLNIYEEMNMNIGINRDTNYADNWRADVVKANMDCYVYTSDHMSDAIYGYSVLSGFSEQPEEWTYGMIICRYSPDLTQKWSSSIGQHGQSNHGRGMGVYDTIAYMEANDLPWSGILAEAWGPYDEFKHKDLKELCDYVHSLGKKFLVYIAVGSAAPAQTGYLEDYLVSMTDPDGNTTTKLPMSDSNNPDSGFGKGTFRYVDITNPEAVEWYFGKYWDLLTNEIGVDGCKIDFCELMPEYNQLNYYNKDQPTSGSHHWYPTAFTAMFWDMISAKPDSGMNYTRGGGIGSQRGPYMWAGDQLRTMEQIKYQLRSCLSAGMSGIPFMSYDMSGYQYGSGSGLGTGQNDQPYTEGKVFVRGLQFTAFSICMQQHGKVRQAFEFSTGVIKKEFIKSADGTYGTWTNKTVKDADGNVVYAKDKNGELIPLKDSFGNIQTNDKGETLYQPEYEYLIKPGEMSYITDIYRAYVKLHEYLTPYINEYSAIACETGMPLMRTLALMWQDDTKTYKIDDEYMFGDAFLVAPILDESYYRNIYLPEGKWKDLNTGRVYEVGPEGQTLLMQKVELEQLPVFYNMNTTSKTAPDLLSGIQEIFDFINAIDCENYYITTGFRP